MRMDDMTQRRLMALSLALTVGISACSGGTDDAIDSTDSTGSTVSVDDEGSVDEGSVDDGSGDEGSLDDESTGTSEPLDDATPVIPDVEPILTGAPQILTLTPVVVDRLRPTLSWEPVDGAMEYSVVVLDDAGDPYWMWLGSDSEVPLGGVESSDFGVGPIIGTDYTWSVVAFGADRELLGASGRLPISAE